MALKPTYRLVEPTAIRGERGIYALMQAYAMVLLHSHPNVPPTDRLTIELRGRKRTSRNQGAGRIEKELRVCGSRSGLGGYPKISCLVISQSCIV